MLKLFKSRCERKGHDWFPCIHSEFIPNVDTCLRCPEKRPLFPYGICMGGAHSLADHYEWDGENLNPRSVEHCKGPH